MDLSRQMGLLPPEALKATKINLIGVGGIGCPTASALAHMGVPIIQLFDGDTVEEHNRPTQILYRRTDVGRFKVDAAKEVLEMFTDAKILTVPSRFDGSQKLEGIVISAVDSMASRKVIWEKVRYNIHVPLYVEARMGGQTLITYTLSPTDPDAVKRYEETLYSDAEATTEPCTEKAIVYTVLFAGGVIANQVKKYLMGETYEFEIMMDLMNMEMMVQ